jgi:dynein heavy chain
MWTSGVEAAIHQIMGGKNKGALKEFLQFSDEQLQAMIALVRGNLGKQERALMGALIVLDVHAKTVVEGMIKERVEDINSFPW